MRGYLFKIRGYILRNQALVVVVAVSIALFGFMLHDMFWKTTGMAAKVNLKRPVELAQHVGDTKGVVVRSYPWFGIESHDVTVTFADDSKAEFIGITDHTFAEVDTAYLKALPAEKVSLEILEQTFNWSGLINSLASLLFFGMIVYSVKNQASMMGGSKFDQVNPDAIKDTFDDLIGMDDIKAEVRQLVNLIKNPEVYKAHGIQRPMNMLFTGPAGTGKTRIVAIIARELGVPLLTINASNLENGFLAGGSNTLKSIHNHARSLGRCIVFIDEGQSLLLKRGQGHGFMGKHADATANTLLSILDGVDRHKDGQALWIVATNFDEQTMPMDEAMSRRFGFKINFRLPNVAERYEMLKRFFGRRADCLDGNLNLRTIADVTAGLSPALLETIADKAAMMAIQDGQKISTNTAMQAFERTTVGLTNRATTADQEKAREVVACHELGHFFALFSRYWIEGKSLADIQDVIPVIKISTESLAKGEGGALGFVLQRQEETALKSRCDLEWDVVKLYGGAAAEEVFFGQENLTTGAYQDIQQATKILKTMVADLSMYSDRKVSYSVLMGDNPSESVVVEIENKADALYKKAVSNVAQYRNLIEVIQPVLLERYTLNIEEAFSLIEQHVGLLPQRAG